MSDGQERARVLSKAEVRRLLGAADPTIMTGLRNRTALELGLWSGLRVGEVCGIRAGDYNAEGKQLAVRDGHGRVDRTIPVRHDTSEWCRRWEAKRDPAARWWLHTIKAGVVKSGEERPAGGPLSRDNLRQALLHLARKGSVDREGLTWQTLRRTFAKTALARGLSRGDLGQLMGLGPGSIERYVEGEVGDLADRVEALSLQPALRERRVVDPMIERLVAAFGELGEGERRELVDLVEGRQRERDGDDRVGLKTGPSRGERQEGELR